MSDPKDLTDNVALAEHEAEVAVATVDSSQPISNTVSGVRVPGSFQLDIEDSLNFLDSNLGEVRNLHVRLRETDRSTGNFVQLTHKANLEIKCDFNKFISFNDGTDETLDDDSYQLTGITLTNDVNVSGAGQGKRVANADYKLDLNPALDAGEGFTANRCDYNSTAKTLTTVNFPVGAVLIDLATHLSGLGVGDKSVTIGSTTNNATYQVKADKTIIGLTLFGKIILDCGNTSGSPQLSADASFAPAEGIVLGGNNHNSITITLLNQENFTKAQHVELAWGQQGAEESLVGINYEGDPDAAASDDFDILLPLSALGGEGQAGSIGASMIGGIKGSVQQKANLVKTFSVAVEQIDFKVDSDLSGYLRELAKAADRADAMPIKNGEKLLVQNPATVNFKVTPFQYSFYSAGYAADIAEFNMLSGMEVYAVLKHEENRATPVLKTDGMTPL